MDASIYRLRLRDILTLCVLSLLLLGVIMVQSASMNATGDAVWQWTQRGTKHLMFAAISIVTFFIVGNFDYKWLLKGKSFKTGPICLYVIVSIIACMLVLVPHVGIAVNGARRWLPLGPVQVQPSELAKWAAV